MQAYQQASLTREVACFHRQDVKITVGALSVTRVASMDQSTSTPNDLELAADLVSAYVSHNPLPASDLPSLIAAVHAALRQVGGAKAEQPSEELPRPAVPIRKSITPDHL